MIENLEKKLLLTKRIGDLIYEGFRSSKSCRLLEIVSFEKGKEIGSNNYLEFSSDQTIPYVRVADLTSRAHNIFVIRNEEILKIVHNNDILLALDGAPGRNSFGHMGAISSGIYALKSEEINKGLIYFAINSRENSKIIKDSSSGTTILHASQAIPFLIYKDLTKEKILDLNHMFEKMLSIRAKLDILHKQKELLLTKYFSTN